MERIWKEAALTCFKVRLLTILAVATKNKNAINNRKVNVSPGPIMNAGHPNTQQECQPFDRGMINQKRKLGRIFQAHSLKLRSATISFVMSV
jgi:hypothetical protein